MTKTEALQALRFNDNEPIIVCSRSGAEYYVSLDVVELSTAEHKFTVYGSRVNAPKRGPFRRGPKNGSIRWFSLNGVVLAPFVIKDFTK